ncbi:hypothetical protein FBZ83_111128 [Azospirillum brasilense]|uniref:Uncharacterized protein n=1 Tax=Azospirillum brasilense TaxID=192 RepID=A0A560C329_AZOBR|nr:hypothetical protein [Azospirillum brasilense]TWA79270.1 hypothetical protein FBZ83_111128 [Azospirillum brasilense]
MTGKHEQSPEHRKAHDLAEEAIETAAQGDTRKAKGLADEAKSIDPKIDREMARELEDDRRQAENYKGKAGEAT